MRITVGTLCFTCGSRIPANNDLLVVVTEIDPARTPHCYAVRQVTGAPFPSTTRPNGLRRWQEESTAWTTRSRLRPIDPGGIMVPLSRRSHVPA